MRAHQALSTNSTTTRRQTPPSQQRHRGRFVSDLSRPGVSLSTRLRNERRNRQETPEQRRKNVGACVSALLCPGEDRDYVPATANHGPLIEIDREIIKPEHSMAVRLMYGVAREEYLKRTKIRTVPRRDIKRNGVIVKARAYVFLKTRLPDPSVPGTLISLKRFIAKLSREGKIRHESVEATLDRIEPFLQSYNSNTFEYSRYLPRTDSGDVIERSTIPSVVATAPTDEQIYVTRIDVMAGMDSEYLLLKTVLDGTNPIVFRAAVQKWQRVLSSLRDAGNLTSLEQAIIDYAQIEDAEKRLLLEQGLKKLLLCLMQIRQIDGKDLMLNKGYNPPGFFWIQMVRKELCGFHHKNSD